ncbi:MAG TPA: PilZ domain-containing protein [Archangium sp.]|uniref:PilZ domain-containing protein n=1 Tax=Archangium sp. TaxID=1872627 RepID=UPI002E327618|nr:PilZ domain-containing protein [Archangium sp.]HEX5748599.1 PilZ domain-containing protein [Archangium sp.]
MSEQSKDDGQRRADERRESPRVPMRIRVRRENSSQAFDSREGNISLGGFAWFGTSLSVGMKVEARFTLPGSTEELQVRGEVLHVAHGSRGSSAHVRFLDLPVELEMLIARYLDDLELAESKRGGGP